MTELMRIHALLWVVLKWSIDNDQKLTYNGEVHYDPRDFSYWGA